MKGRKFDLVIGNPPFIRGALSNYSKHWTINDNTISIPQGQIALKFLSESFEYIKEHGIVCMIIKSSELLYSSTSTIYKKSLFLNFNVIQLFDFTMLAEGKSLWDNGARVGATVIFVKNEKPDFTKNILHLTFKRTKATSERIVFEIDDYDLHFIDRQTAINNEFIWKINLLGGGRIRSIFEKVQDFSTLEDFLLKNDCKAEEGYIEEHIINDKKPIPAKYIYNIPSLPTEAISENKIDCEALFKLPKKTRFLKLPCEDAFTAPNLLIWENIGEKRLPVFYNTETFSFKRSIIGIFSKTKNINILRKIELFFENNSDFCRFYILATSSKTLINRNTTFLLEDLKRIPFSKGTLSLSTADIKVINDCIEYQRDFIAHGGLSKALMPINDFNIESVLENYGNEFSNSLNTAYNKNNRKFRLSDVIKLDSSLIAAVFKYDSNDYKIKYHSDLSNINIECLTKNNISSQLSINRIIKLYPQKDTIVFVKPNQYRYWISLTAYRDADKCSSDFSEAGF
jgi:hypothetical protein